MTSAYKIKFITATAAADSMTGTALGTMHGSWRPFIESVVSQPFCRSTVFCSIEIEGVGFTAARKTIGIPLVMPPRAPPWLLVRVRTAPFSSK